MIVMGGFMGAATLAAKQGRGKSAEEKTPSSPISPAEIVGLKSTIEHENRSKEISAILGRDETLEERQDREISEYGYSMIETPMLSEHQHFNTTIHQWEKCTAKIRRCKYAKHQDITVRGW